MNKIKFLSIDSSLANTGTAAGYITRNMEIVVEDIELVTTSKSKDKRIRASSDTIDRCKRTYRQVHRLIEYHKPDIIFVETPSGSQNSSAMKSYGSTCMLIASLDRAIQVTPVEVKEKSIGKKNASKREMIDWAHSKYPTLKWNYRGVDLQNNNEHMADAIAIAHASVQTDEFKLFFHAYMK